ncbi:Glutathione biosynthesis bifunctional protein GshAB [compost metagenome]
MTNPLNESSNNIALLATALGELDYQAELLHLDGIAHARFSKHGIVRWLTTITPAIAYPATNAALRQISRNKSMANAFISQEGFNTPGTAVCSIADTANAHQLLAKVGRVIVKPEFGSLSRGLTLDVTTDEALDVAIKKAAGDNGHNAVVQQQVHGDEIRFVVIGGELKGAILRQTPRVIGDGASTLHQLIEKENQARTAITATMVAYPQLDENVIDGDLITSRVVPGKDEVVELGKGTMISTGASIYDITDDIHDSYRRIVEEVACKLGAQFVVVDMILAEYTQPADENYWFIEFNTSPVLKLFYACRDGRHFPAATHLAQMIDRCTALQTNIQSK